MFDCRGPLVFLKITEEGFFQGQRSHFGTTYVLLNGIACVCLEAKLGNICPAHNSALHWLAGCGGSKREGGWGSGSLLSSTAFLQCSSGSLHAYTINLVRVAFLQGVSACQVVVTQCRSLRIWWESISKDQAMAKFSLAIPGGTHIASQSVHQQHCVDRQGT